MADRKPLVFLANNRISELPSGDTLSWLWLSDVPVYASRWPTWDEVEDKPSTFPAAWGSITGNIYDQTDLVSEISDKADKDSVVNTTDNQTNIQGDKEWQGAHTFYGEGPRFLGAATNVTGPRPSFQLRTEADNRRIRIRYDASEAVDGPFMVQKYISGSWTTVLETDVSASELYIRGKRFWHDDNLNSGSLIPTCSPNTNVATCSANTCQWVKTGDKVTYSGSVVISPAATGASCSVRISLPIPSTFADSLEVSGPASGKAVGVPNYEVGQITANPATNDLGLSFYPTSTNAYTMRFCVVYPIQ